MFLKKWSISQILGLLVLLFKNGNIYQECYLDDLEDNEKSSVSPVLYMLKKSIHWTEYIWVFIMKLTSKVVTVVQISAYASRKQPP